MPVRHNWKVQRFQAIKALNKAVATHMAKHKIEEINKQVVYDHYFKKLDAYTQQLILRKG